MNMANTAADLSLLTPAICYLLTLSAAMDWNMLLSLKNTNLNFA